MIPYCTETGVGRIPWSPISRGVLARPWGSRSTEREKSDGLLKNLIRVREGEVDKQIVDRVEEIANKKGIKMAQVATAWSLRSGDYPIVGLSSKERIDETIAALKVKLTDEEAKYLEEPYMPKTIAGH